MSYNPTTWNTGDIVTSEKLNKIENQLEKTGGVLVVHPNIETGQLDHTYAEIAAADVVVLRFDPTNGAPQLCFLTGFLLSGSNGIGVVFVTFPGDTAVPLHYDEYWCQSESDYPVLDNSGGK